MLAIVDRTPTARQPNASENPEDCFLRQAFWDQIFDLLERSPWTAPLPISAKLFLVEAPADETLSDNTIVTDVLYVFPTRDFGQRAMKKGNVRVQPSRGRPGVLRERWDGYLMYATICTMAYSHLCVRLWGREMGVESSTQVHLSKPDSLSVIKEALIRTIRGYYSVETPDGPLSS